jgi:hypothetical protein
LQQTLSTQKFDMHSAFPVHRAPSGFGPHDPFMQSRPSQSAELVQRSKQRRVSVLQRYGVQTVDISPEQVPPAQIFIASTALPSQVPGMHTLPSGYVWHAPAPSHRPLRPQVSASSAAH